MVLGWFVEDCRQTIRGRTHKHLFMYWSFGKHRLGFLLVSLRRGELRMCDRGGESLMVGVLVKKECVGSWMSTCSAPWLLS